MHALKKKEITFALSPHYDDTSLPYRRSRIRAEEDEHLLMAMSYDINIVILLCVSNMNIWKL